MITWAIAIVFMIAGYVAASNGEWGSFGVCAVIVVVLFLLKSGAKENARAYNNFIDYWSSSGKKRAMMRHEWERDASAEEARIRDKRRRKSEGAYEREQEAKGLTKAGDSWTAGSVSYGNTTYICPACRGVMHEDHRIEYGSGSVFATYKCSKCRKTLPVKIK